MEIESFDRHQPLPRKAGRAPAPRALCRCTRAPNNKSGESYGALHPPRVRHGGPWRGRRRRRRRVRIDSGRWRRGHRLALLGVMTLTQCSAMASPSPTHPPLAAVFPPPPRRRRGGKDFAFEDPRLKGLEGVST